MTAALLYWIAFSYVAGMLAQARGRRGDRWFLLAIAASPPIALGALYSRPRRRGMPAPEQSNHWWQPADDYDFEVAGTLSHQHELAECVIDLALDPENAICHALLVPDRDPSPDKGASVNGPPVLGVSVHINGKRVAVLSDFDSERYCRFLRQAGIPGQAVWCWANITGGRNFRGDLRGFLSVKLSLAWPPQLA
jgi:hypothetical protein